MFDRKGLLSAAATILTLVLVAGCGSLPGGDGDEERKIVVGTTSAPSTLDPAAAWDGSWELYRNIFQTLMTIPSSGTTPEPEAARNCAFTDSASRIYRCELRKGLKFSNGRPLDAEAVKHTFDRITSIESPSGPAALLANLRRVDTRGSHVVIFRLEKSDATFPFILSTPATSLVDPEEYPGATLRPGNRATGSGPYELKSYEPGKRAVLVENDDYKGTAEIRNDAVTIKYYKRSAQMVSDLEAGRIDLTYRGLTPSQIMEFQDAAAMGDTSVDLSEMTGSEVHFLVFNPKDKQAGKLAVRRAVAQLVDRKELVREVYDRTATPLYSMVPTGIAGHTNAFLNRYGEPDPDRARKTLRNAGITDKVRLTLWYSEGRYGDSTSREFAELKEQLEDSGLFDITLRSRSWDAFQKGYLAGEYPVFGRGWSGDFPDADNYITPFVGEENAVGTPYRNRELTEELLPYSRRQSDRGAAGQSFAKVQRMMADDAQLLPLWQGKIYIAAEKDVAGVESSVDASVIMRVWELYKKSSW
ncbi:ABC transporter substrate-binding protein [Streptomyces sp. B15]|uniref:ABC transporter substrate-binding protein n=1 Tax=Streptomyces sp. B15 TaxID=1537797 RepID=UPI001B39B286|nr:ABC transporter substrate-binding protein [Streptomyces sp. B15]MBQ1124081.1 peptide-binding protein [Streptomyces sp. B15]